MKHYTPFILIISILFFLCGTLYSQKDTLYVHHNDTITLSIDQKIPSTICWIYGDSLKEVSVYFHFITNSENPVFMTVYTGDGPLVFFHHAVGPIITFENGQCFGELLYSIYKHEGKAILKDKNVSLKIIENINNELITTHREFKYIGKRDD